MVILATATWLVKTSSYWPLSVIGNQPGTARVYSLCVLYPSPSHPRSLLSAIEALEIDVMSLVRLARGLPLCCYQCLMLFQAGTSTGTFEEALEFITPSPLHSPLTALEVTKYLRTTDKAVSKLPPDAFMLYIHIGTHEI